MTTTRKLFLTKDLRGLQLLALGARKSDGIDGIVRRTSEPSFFIGDSMSINALRLSDLAGLPDVARNERLSSFYAQSSVPNGSLDHIRGQVREFERLHEMSSSEMKRELEAGTMRETAAVCRWLMFLELQDRLEQPATGPT